MNFLDKAIGYFSPEKAAKRARARVQIAASSQIMQRGYDAAKRSRRANGWAVSGGSADAELQGALPLMRYRSRELVRNNPYAARAIDILVGNTIGTGITPTLGKNKRIKKVWADWAGSTQCDADGHNNFNGLQRLIARTVEESGECFVRFRMRRPEDGMTIPLQLQVLEPDYLDISKGEYGIEYDGIGRRVAYWLFKSHPGGTNLKTVESVRVDAADVLHIFDKKRPGQNRGVPRLAPVVVKLNDTGEYQEAALVKAKIEACFGVFVTRPDAGEITPLGPSETDSDGNRVETLEPGMTVYLQPGEKPEFANPSSAGAFEPYMLHNLMAIAVGAGVTYDQLTGDLRQANYSSLRAGKIEFRRLVEQMQWLVYVPQLCEPVFRKVFEVAVLAGVIKTAPALAGWQPPRHEPIDPQKDLGADIDAIRAGIMTLPQAIARNGYDPQEQFEEIAAANAEMDRLGLVLDTDPRKVSNAGMTQARPNGTAIPSPNVSEGVQDNESGSDQEG